MTENEKILHTLDKLASSVENIQQCQMAVKLELAVWRSSQSELCKQACKQRDVHDKILFGNGQPGICQRVQSMEDSMPKELKTRLRELENKVSYIWFGLIAFILEAVRATLNFFSSRS
jgi:hypothetical protein